MTLEMEPIQRLTKDIRNAAKILTAKEARYLVDAYYQIQEYRKASANQVRSLNESGEPNDTINWLFNQMTTLETQIKNALNAYTDAHPVGKWLKSIPGIGPVIAAGLLAHVDITKAPTVGHIWSFAGLNPNAQWNKGEKRPWNADLKTLCWKIGESFVKVSNKENDIYGKVYKERKVLEIANNESGLFADQAARKLEKFNIGKDTDAYKAYIQGKLPPAHIQERSKRYAVKLFLSHMHHVMYLNHYNCEPPKPYPIAILGHAHMVAPPLIEEVSVSKEAM